MSSQVRLVLFSGKGGVGKSTLAAATAVQLADAGRRVHLVSTDPAHSCGDVLGIAMQPGTPNVVNERLSVTILDAHIQRTRSWRSLQAGNMVRALGLLLQNLWALPLAIFELLRKCFNSFKSL